MNDPCDYNDKYTDMNHEQLINECREMDSRIKWFLNKKHLKKLSKEITDYTRAREAHTISESTMRRYAQKTTLLEKEVADNNVTISKLNDVIRELKEEINGLYEEKAGAGL